MEQTTHQVMVPEAGDVRWFTVRISPQLKRQIQQLSLDTGRTQESLGEEALEDILRKYEGKR